VMLREVFELLCVSAPVSVTVSVSVSVSVQHHETCRYVKLLQERNFLQKLDVPTRFVMLEGFRDVRRYFRVIYDLVVFCV